MIKFLQVAAEVATNVADTTAQVVEKVEAVAAEATQAVADTLGEEMVEPTFFQKYGNWIMIGAMVLIFYFFMIRPQQKARKKEQEMRDSLKAGDKIMTIGGIHGVIKKVDDDSFLIEVDSNVTLRLAKQAVTPMPQAQK